MFSSFFISLRIRSKKVMDHFILFFICTCLFAPVDFNMTEPILRKKIHLSRGLFCETLSIVAKMARIISSFLMMFRKRDTSVIAAIWCFDLGNIIFICRELYHSRVRFVIKENLVFRWILLEIVQGEITSDHFSSQNNARLWHFTTFVNDINNFFLFWNFLNFIMTKPKNEIDITLICLELFSII